MNNYFWVYILRCSDDSYYVGHTDNIDKRLAEHHANRYSCYTSKRLPVTLVFQQSFSTRDEAFVCERQIKKWRRAKKEALIRGDWQALQEAAKKKK